MDKPESYPECFAKEVALLKDKFVSKIRNKVLPPRYVPDVRKVCDELKEMNLKRGLLTTALDLVARYVQKDLNLDFCYCNELITKGNHFTGEGRLIVDLWKKDVMLDKLCDEIGINTQQAIVVGDNFNDLPMFRLSGLPIAFNPKVEEVKKSTRYTIHNLAELPVVIKNHVLIPLKKR
jgi:phosphoserine phosphatase